MFARLPTRLATSALSPFLLAGCLVFAGCADQSAMSPSQRAVQQSKNRFVTTTAEGAGAGALLGALIGAAAGGGRGALIGAAAGGVAGGVAGAAVAQNNYERGRNEGTLTAYIDEANRQAADAQQDAYNASNLAREARARTVQLRAQFRAGQINAAQYRSQLSSYSSSLADLRKISAAQSEQIASYRRDGSSAGSQGAMLISASNSIAKSKSNLDQSISEVASMLADEPR